MFPSLGHMREITEMERARIGATIRTLREAYGWKLGQLAQAVGISHSYLSNIEYGRKAASMPVLRRIAEVLTVPLGAIVSAEYSGEAPSNGAAA